jgi:putative endonuclease
MRAKDELGRYGEEIAARHLLAAGYTIHDRNWRCDSGELDIVAQMGGVLVFVEVKTRASTRFGLPAEAISSVKAQRIRGLSLRWLVARRPVFAEMRFDVLSVMCSAAGEPASVEHIEGAF